MNEPMHDYNTSDGSKELPCQHILICASLRYIELTLVKGVRGEEGKRERF